MEETLQISTAGKQIPIVRDGAPVGTLRFHPDDVVFAEKFYRLYAQIQEKFTQYQQRAYALEAETKKDAAGLPANLGERIALAKEACVFAYEQIDALFGSGTSTMVFGDTFLVDAILQFLQGVQPHIVNVRAEKIQKYTNKRTKRNGKN